MSNVPKKTPPTNGIQHRSAPLLDGERLRTIGPIEIFKADHGQLGCARHELKDSALTKKSQMISYDLLI